MNDFYQKATYLFYLQKHPLLFEETVEGKMSPYLGNTVIIFIYNPFTLKFKIWFKYVGDIVLIRTHGIEKLKEFTIHQNSELKKLT